jgi:broad specificity polyphosphatase/5'/3'-nucleotidase SurE
VANPKPTAAQIGLIVLGAGVGAGIGFGLLSVGTMIAGAITGAGAGIGAVPYSMAVQAQKKREKEAERGA